MSVHVKVRFSVSHTSICGMEYGGRAHSLKGLLGSNCKQDRAYMFSGYSPLAPVFSHSSQVPVHTCVICYCMLCIHLQLQFSHSIIIVHTVVGIPAMHPCIHNQRCTWSAKSMVNMHMHLPIIFTINDSKTNSNANTS